MLPAVPWNTRKLAVQLLPVGSNVGFCISKAKYVPALLGPVRASADAWRNAVYTPPDLARARVIATSASNVPSGMGTRDTSVPPLAPEAVSPAALGESVPAEAHLVLLCYKQTF
jgi:hypothetical protein